MKVYKHGEKEQETTVIVQPGREYPDVKGWMTIQRGEDGKEVPHATVFNVKFERGVAKVDDNLGKYMVDKGYAEASPVLNPERLRPGAVSYNGVSGHDMEIAKRTEIIFS